jgi:hypothetical protein
MILISVTQVRAIEKTIAIDKQMITPFKGFLVPEWQFRKLNQELLEKDLMQKVDLKPHVEEAHPFQNFMWGFLAGSASVFLIDKLGAK